MPEPQTVEEQVLAQLDDIYSKENLEKDSFFREMTEQDPEGWITFKRLAMIKRFKTIINGDVTLFAKAVELAPERFQIKDDLYLRFTPKTAEEIEKDKIEEKEKKMKGYLHVQNERSIYAKGFPTEKEPTRDELIKLFETYGRVIHIKFRREDDKSFKGSVFVEYETPEMVNLALASDLKFNDNDLVMMKKQDYIDMKSKEKFNGETQWGFGESERNRDFYLEFSGAEEMADHQVKELFSEHKLDFGRFERLSTKGCGIVQLINGKTPDDYLKELEAKDLGSLTFRLATDESRRFYREKRRQFKEKKNRGGRGGRGGRGRGGSGFKRNRNDDSKEQSQEKKIKN